MNPAASEPAIRLRDISKFYKYYEREIDRVKEILSGRPRYHMQYALQDLSLDVAPGEVLGVVGKNGAGKSTLLKMLANTLQPSAGSLTINGRVAALLELGASFHPEMTGHENIYLNCSILGLKRREVDAIYERIVAFSGVGEFIHRPVKTYSSGMFVRLAFSVATHIDPDILIIDEALSVGDGVFARKSFDRIMQFKDAGKTILFCTHSLFQIEAICDRVLWLENGKVKALGNPAEVVTEYGESLRRESPRQDRVLEGAEELEDPAASRGPAGGRVAGHARASNAGDEDMGANDRGSEAAAAAQANVAEGMPADSADRLTATPRILDIKVYADGKLARSHLVHCGESTIEVDVRFTLPDNLPIPTVAIAFTGGDGRALASVGSLNDGAVLARDAQGDGRAKVSFPGFPLLKGRYNIDVYLMCEKGVHIYEAVVQAAELNVRQKSLERGLVRLPHQWEDPLATPEAQPDSTVRPAEEAELPAAHLDTCEPQAGPRKAGA